MENQTVKIAVVQLKVVLNAEKRNLRKGLEAIRVAAFNGARLVCLPEAFKTSMNLTNIERVAESIPGGTTELLCETAKECGVYICAGLLEKDGRSYYSTMFLIDDNGHILTKYRRSSVYSLEKKYLKEGNKTEVIETAIGRIGIIGGFDLFFPSICEKLFRDNVEIIICPALLPDHFRYVAEKLVYARAIDNACCFVYASGIGGNQFANLNYMGNSQVVVDPNYMNQILFDYMEKDELLAKASSEEEIVYAELNRSGLIHYIKKNPIFLFTK